MQSQLPKQYLPVAGKPVARHSFDVLSSIDSIQEIVVVCEEEFEEVFTERASKMPIFSRPGPRRQDSVKNGFVKIAKDTEFVLIHDAARPLIQEANIISLIQEGLDHPASALAVRERNTLKRVDADQNVIETVDRSQIWETQTPQMCRVPLLEEAFAYADAHQITVTDDLALIELLGISSHLVEGSHFNIKLTYPDDLLLCQFVLEHNAYAKI